MELIKTAKVLVRKLEGLKPNPINEVIYGKEEVEEALFESISDHGVLVPIVIKNDGTIISGHRRYYAAKQAMLISVPAIIVRYDNELDEKEAILLYNKQRVKSFEQTMAEADMLKEIIALRAKARQMSSRSKTSIPTNAVVEPAMVVATLPPPNSSKGKTRDIVAELVGMKGRTFSKADAIWEKAKAGDESAKKMVVELNAKNISINKAHNEINKEMKIEERKASLQKQKDDIASGKVKLPEGKFEIIVIDPPWKYDRKYDPDVSRVAPSYPEMSQDELLKLDIPATDDAIMLLWTTHQFIFDAKALLDKWGFTYKGIIVWDKDRMGMGATVRMQCEFCLLGFKGKVGNAKDSKVIWANTHYRDIIVEKGREHSRKPDEFYTLVEYATEDSPRARKLDYFSREKREGWATFGNDDSKFTPKEEQL